MSVLDMLRKICQFIRQIIFGRYAADINSQLSSLYEELIHSRKEIHHHLHQVKQSVHLIARSREPSLPIKCLFLVHSPETWSSLSGVYLAMLGNDKFKPIVASISRRYPGAKKYNHEPSVHRFLEEKHIPHLRFGLEDSYDSLDIIKAIDPAVIFKQSIWDLDVPPGFAAGELRFSRLCYIPYSMLNLVCGLENDAASTFTDDYLQRSCWRIFCANEDVKKIYKSNLIGRVDNVRITGHPKYPEIKAAKPTWPTARNTGSSRLKVLWSAHHSVGDDWACFGVFGKIMIAMLDYAEKNPEIDFVFAPHPALFDKCNDVFSGDRALIRHIEIFHDRWEALPNTHIEKGYEYVELFAGSDVLLCDGISCLVEYQILNKPIIFLERKDHLPFNAIGEMVMEGVNRVPNIETAFELIERYKNGLPDEKKEHQEKIIEQLFSVPDAAERVVHELYEGICEEYAEYPRVSSA
jgi:hypothetical protein